MLWLWLNFLKECSGCVFDRVQHSQGEPLRAKLQGFTSDLGPGTEALSKKETDGCWGSTVEHHSPCRKS